MSKVENVIIVAGSVGLGNAKLWTEVEYVTVIMSIEAEVWEEGSPYWIIRVDTAVFFLV